MKITLVFSLLVTAVPLLTQASEIKECQTKINQMVNQVKKQEITVLTRKSKTEFEAEAKFESDFLSADGTCGVEYVEDKGYFTVNNFRKVGDDELSAEEKAGLAGKTNLSESTKHETISLNENDSAYADGRIKAKVSCSISGDSVEFITSVPVFSDGVRSMWVEKKLEISQVGNQLIFKSIAGLKPISAVLKSVTSCTLQF